MVDIVGDELEAIPVLLGVVTTFKSIGTIGPSPSLWKLLLWAVVGVVTVFKLTTAIGAKLAEAVATVGVASTMFMLTGALVELAEAVAMLVAVVVVST